MATSAPPQRFLIVNGDDFGRSAGVNRGIIQAHRSGILTSASIMVRWEASGEAAAYALGSPTLSLGIHLDLGEWYRTEAGWEPVYENVDLSDSDAVRTEIANQLGRFHKLMNRPPTHIDSHQHVHREEPVRSIVSEFARRLDCPVRGLTSTISYCGEFYGQHSDGSVNGEAITARALINLLGRLGPGLTEMGCHPGEDEDLDNAYATERHLELRALCDPEVRKTLMKQGIVLVSYHDYGAAIRTNSRTSQ
jgi:predicted glycoside hydrolase/deacetylase ChbG (UPF0249 family)